MKTLVRVEFFQLPDHVKPVTFRTACRFVCAHHYLGYSPQGHKFSLGVFARVDMLGVMIFGRPVSRYEDNGETLELTRMVLFDSPKNSESKALSLAEKWIRKHYSSYSRLIAYSDLSVGHKGTIYKAANWQVCEAPGGGLPWNITRKNRKGRIGGKKLKFVRMLAQ